MRTRFSLRAIFLVVFVVAATLAFLKPVADISPAASARILPGMTKDEAIKVVGAPPGWYDGVGGVDSGAPHEKGHGPCWTGMRGEIAVDLDESGRVTRSMFYPVRVIGWWLPGYFWERFTRIQYMGLGEITRVCFFVVLTAIATLILGWNLIGAAAKNMAAYHGLIGLTVGVVLALAIFSGDFVSDDFSLDPVVTLLALSSALVCGAFIGISVGFIRGGLPRWWSRHTQENAIANSAAA